MNMNNNKKFKRVLLASILLIPIMSLTTFADQIIIPAGTNKSVKGPEEYFTGDAQIDMLYNPTKETPVSAGYVTFEPGARTNWHIHQKGQQLIVTSGVGLTQEWGGKIQEIRSGDVVICPPNVKHWHGAAPETAMTHLAVTSYDEKGNGVEWMEKVTDKQYSEK